MRIDKGKGESRPKFRLIISFLLRLRGLAVNPDCIAIYLDDVSPLVHVLSDLAGYPDLGCILMQFLGIEPPETFFLPCSLVYGTVRKKRGESHPQNRRVLFKCARWLYSTVMSQQDNFDRIVSALHEAALDDTLWPSASALIDEAVGMVGSHLVIFSGHSRADAACLFGERYDHGELIEEAREYAQDYFLHDERIPRLLHLPDSQIFHVTNVYAEQELKTSLTYNELLCQFSAGNGLNVRMNGPDGLHIAWALTDPHDPHGWGSEQIVLIEQLLPHIRQFVRVRQALAKAEALRASLIQLLDNAAIGVLYLNRRGTIVQTNTRALAILRRGDGLKDRGGFLRARFLTDNAKLQRLVARALPHWGQTVSSGSLTVRRTPGKLPLTLHISPVDHRADFGAQRVAALVLIVDPVERPRVDPASLVTTLGLTRTESQVAAALVAGHSVRDIAVSTYRTQASVRWHLKQMHAKLGISRQADLVRMVLSTVGVPLPRA